MWLSWHDRLAERPELRRIENWPQISIDDLHDDQKQQFLCNLRIVAQTLGGKSLSSVAQQNNFHKSRISVMLSRALAGEESEDPPLTKALIPGIRIKESKRRMPLSSLAKTAGSKGSFIYLLDNVPRLRERLEIMIKSSVNQKPYSQNLTPKIIHAEFKRLLQEANWPTTEYPYTEASQGYETLRRFLNKKCQEFSTVVVPKRVIHTRRSELRACREIQADEHTIDLFGRADIVLNENLIPLRLARCKLILAVDSATSCILAYRLVLSEEVNQFDILSLFASMFYLWQPLDLTTPGLQYTPGACLPAYFGGEFLRMGFGIVRLDNALVHLAASVKNYICSDLCATLNLGLPAQPKGRSHIEHAINIAATCAHRFASTSGAHPKDPNRETLKNSKKPPVITLAALEEALSVTLTHHNVVPQTSLGNATPIEVLRYQMANSPVRLLPPVLMPTHPFIYSEIVSIKRIASERRRPHINFLYVRYVGDALDQLTPKYTKVRIECDYRDIRNLKVFSLHGQFLGEVSVQGGWIRFPHSITTRKKIFRENKTARISMRDPLGEYFAQVLQQRDLPSKALELMRISREFGFYSVSPSTSLTSTIANESEQDMPASASDSRILSWYSTIFNNNDHENR